jgi:hypothetical protein
MSFNPRNIKIKRDGTGEYRRYLNALFYDNIPKAIIRQFILRVTKKTVLTEKSFLTQISPEGSVIHNSPEKAQELFSLYKSQNQSIEKHNSTLRDVEIKKLTVRTNLENSFNLDEKMLFNTFTLARPHKSIESYYVGPSELKPKIKAL